MIFSDGMQLKIGLSLDMKPSFLRPCYISPEFQKSIIVKITGVPNLHVFHYCGSNYLVVWLMYTQLGDFRASWGLPTVPIKQILRNAIFFKSQNPCKGGPCKFIILVRRQSSDQSLRKYYSLFGCFSLPYALIWDFLFIKSHVLLVFKKIKKKSTFLF